jgi:hypothetical protein
LPGLSYIYYESGSTETGVTKRFYNHSDHLGSIIAVSNEQGKWSSSASMTLGQEPVDRQWAGLCFPPLAIGHHPTRIYRHEEVDELGIIHMNGRIYDADIGRFLQADPLCRLPPTCRILTAIAMC